ncbi:hypothetical protein SDC9_80321 [bioreactor metagenome]|uniref:Uncharacterized protein n=1 Tax=bioreactor metagenome TaxID=1076179 RepID=A0A644Z4U7_9ZZZZ
MLFHKFGHVKTYERFNRIKKRIRKTFYKLCFSYAGRPGKYERHGFSLIRDTAASALYGTAHSIYGFILTYYSFIKRFGKVDYLFEFVFGYICGGNTRPCLYNLGKVIFSQHDRIAFL